MMLKRVQDVVLLVAVLLILVGCSAAALPLSGVLAAFPRDLSDVMLLFTDWSQVKMKLGLEHVTSDSPLTDRIELARGSTQDLAVATAFGLADIGTHAENWGWDTADLEWEAQLISSELAPIYLLKLRRDFDFARMATHLTDREFTQTESRGVLVYAHPVDPSQDWLRTTELSILTTAYVEDERLMILSSSPAALELSLAAWSGEIASMSDDPFMMSAAVHLGPLDSAIVLRGLGECIRFTPNPILEVIESLPDHEGLDALMASIRDRELLVPYRALGVGYRDIEGRRDGTIVFEYDTPELALRDMPARRLLAERGMSSCYDGTRISETYFTVQTCDVEDSAILMTVTPQENQPIRLFRMIFYLDAVFAGCSM